MFYLVLVFVVVSTINVVVNVAYTLWAVKRDVFKCVDTIRKL